MQQIVLQTGTLAGKQIAIWRVDAEFDLPNLAVLVALDSGIIGQIASWHDSLLGLHW